MGPEEGVVKAETYQQQGRKIFAVNLFGIHDKYGIRKIFYSQYNFQQLNSIKIAEISVSSLYQIGKL